MLNRKYSRRFWRAFNEEELYRPPGGAGRDTRREELIKASGHGRPADNDG